MLPIVLSKGAFAGAVTACRREKVGNGRLARSGRLNDLEIPVEAILQAVVEGTHGDGVADGNLENSRDGKEQTQVFEVQIVSRIDSQAEFAGMDRGPSVVVQYFVLRASSECIGVSFSVKLDAIGAGCRYAVHLSQIRVQEKACTDSGFPEFRDDGLKSVPVPAQIPSVIGGQLLGSIGDQRALGGPGLLHHVQEIGCWIPLNIELDRVLGGHGGQIEYVLESRVALVGSRMDGDAVNSGSDAAPSHGDQVRQILVSRVSQQSKFVQINTELGHGFL